MTTDEIESWQVEFHDIVLHDGNEAEVVGIVDEGATFLFLLLIDGETVEVTASANEVWDVVTSFEDE